MRELIHLGYEVGTGEPVKIPLRNMAVTGQTQESGKTTALEALISRSGAPAVAFVTKRGERSFQSSQDVRVARRMPPYFHERSDWQFVQAVLEATMRQPLRPHRSFIISVCQGSTSLADVHRKVKEKLPKAKGFAEGIYTELDAYLNIVIPQLGKLPYVDDVIIHAGLNVMDLGGYSSELQALVIRSVIEWVHRREEGVVTIVPEAWEFIPQGRGSPVKLAAEELIRKGSGLKNYVWIDSQDMAGVEKVILRGCPVWLIGVQREANEVKRALANIPAGIAKPKPADVARLERGQFYACWGTNVVRTYVQPAWLDDERARRVAIGELSVEGIRPGRSVGTARTAGPKESLIEVELNGPGETPMSAALEAKLDRVLSALEHRQATQTAAPASGQAVNGAAEAPPAGLPADEEGLYQRFRARLMKDPAVLKVMLSRPAIEVEVEIPKLELDGKSLKGRVALLWQREFFCKPKRHTDVVKELERTGQQVNSGNTATVLKDLVALGFLTNEADGYLAVPGMKVTRRS